MPIFSLIGLAGSLVLKSSDPTEQKCLWTTLLLITIAPVALVGIFIPELFFAKFRNFLALIAVALALLCGIQIMDYFVPRRGRIHIRAMYLEGPEGSYYFWRGINPAAMAALVYFLGSLPAVHSGRGGYRR